MPPRLKCIQDIVPQLVIGGAKYVLVQVMLENNIHWTGITLSMGVIYSTMELGQNLNGCQGIGNLRTLKSWVETIQ